MEKRNKEGDKDKEQVLRLARSSAGKPRCPLLHFGFIYLLAV